MSITKQNVAAKLAEYLQHRTTLDALVHWAEDTMIEGAFDEADSEVLSAVIARIGLADVRAFGLTWDDCEALLRLLGYEARVEIVAR